MYAEGERSVAEGTHDHAKHLAEIGRNDGKLLFDHRQASMHWDLGKRGERIKALKEAYGPAAAWMDLEAFADYYDDPQASEAEFRRFFLNQPVPLAAPNIFDVVRWSSAPLLNKDVDPPERVALTVAVAPDRRWACIGVAGESDGKTVVLCYSMRGLAGVAGKVLELQESLDIISVRLAGNAARALAPDLTKADVEFDVMSQTEMGAACGAFQQAFFDETLVHVGQPELDRAVANAQTRRVGESEQWDRRDPKVDDSPLVACSAALYEWGLKYDPNYEILESIL